jgi:integrase
MAGRIPSYRNHRPSGLAVVTLNGRDHYLGQYGTPESRSKYEQLVGRWIAGGRRALREPEAGVTVNEVISAYWTHAGRHYRKHGQATTRLAAIRVASRAARKLFGTEPANLFGPAKFKAVRQVWIDKGLKRSTCNLYGQVLKGIFSWAVEEEMVPASVAHGLREVKGLGVGRTSAVESEAVRPVPGDVLESTLAVLPPRGVAMARLQLATGMRPGEVIRVRGRDVDRSLSVWVYTPAEHKTEHHGKARRIAIGPKGQAILGPWLDRAKPDDHCFAAGGKVASAAAYRHMVYRACDQAGVARWSPNQLRHNYGTMIRRAEGLDAAQIMLGHSNADVTQVYAEADLARMAVIAGRWG